MSLYVGYLRIIIASCNVTKQYQLHPSVTPEVIAEAAVADINITGVKMYPQGKALMPRPLHSEAAVLMRFRRHYELRVRRRGGFFGSL